MDVEVVSKRPGGVQDLTAMEQPRAVEQLQTADCGGDCD